VPAAQNPQRPAIEGASDVDRLGMLKVGLEEYSEFVIIDDQELKRKGRSYTVETLKTYANVIPAENLYLIIGMDQFLNFDTWKDFDKILTMANLVVMTRPGYAAPFSIDDLPEGLRPLVGAFDRQFIALTTERNIEFIRMPDSEASSSDVRRRLLTGRSVDRHLTIAVEDYIRSHKLYGPLAEKIGDVEQFTRFVGKALLDKKAINTRGFDLRQIDAPAEFTIAASGTSTRHSSSLAESVMKAVKDEFNVFPQSVEGLHEGRWVLLDYGSLIVHLFYDYVRQEYQIEELWKAGTPLEMK
jgi:nicotinate-nucleotide adenylyltransferase